MGRVQKRDPARGHVGESGIFELGGSSAPPSEQGELLDEPEPADVLERRVADPVLQAFGEIRGLNKQLQSANDALHGVNEALRTKVDQLRLTALELEQMLNGLELGVLLLDQQLVIRHFNDMAAHLLALEHHDLGGSLSAACRNSGPRLAEWCREVLRSGKHIRRHFPSSIGEPLLLHVRRARMDGEPRLILVFAETALPWGSAAVPWGAAP